MSSITIKAGDTLTLPMVWSSGGSPVDLTGYTIASQVRERDGTAVDDLSCTPDADQSTNPGELVVSATNVATAAWPIGVLECDVEFADVSGTIHTDTFEIKVLRAVTR